MSGSGSAWSRPLNNRGRLFSNDVSTGSSGNAASISNKNSSGGGVAVTAAAGGQRPPPGIGIEGGGVGSARFSGWGNRGGGGSSTNDNGHSKKATNANNNNTNANNTTTNANNSQHSERERIILRERFIHLTLSMVGHAVTLTTTNNQILEGIFHTFTPFDSLHDEEMKNKYVIKACRVIQRGEDDGGATNNGEKEIAMEEGGTLVIPSHRVASVRVKSMRLDHANIIMNNGPAAASSPSEGTAVTGEGSGVGGADASTFQTDSQISGGRGGNQALVAAGSVWTSAGDGSDPAPSSIGGRASTPNGGKKGADSLNWRAAAARGGTSASSSTKSSSAPSTGGGGVGGGGSTLDGSIGEWDQFSANERKFNVKASFDENLYTTKLDVSNIDTAKIAEAERIAREIEGTASTNIHIAEERNQAIQTDYDEEDLYSGVLTKDLKARTIAVVPDVPSTAAATAASTTPIISHVEEKKKEAATVGKVMNYAQAAAKKGWTEKIPKNPTPAAAASATATDAKSATSSSTSKTVQLATPSEGKTSLAPLPSNPAEKTAGLELPPEKTSDADTEAKPNDNGNRHMDGEATKDEKGEEAAASATDSTSKPKLNPNAKSFTFNPTAKTFTPSFTAPAASVSPMPPMQPPPPHSMDTHMMMPPHPHLHGDYPVGPPMMGMGMGGPQFAPMHGMMPMMTPQHPHMRQQYPPPYGQQPMPPMPPQHQVVTGSPPPGQEDSTSVTTGEGSETPAPFMQQPGSYAVVPPGGYPSYHYQMLPPGRGGPSPPGTGVYQGPPQMHHHPHMQVMPGMAPYGAPPPPRMYTQSQHMMQQNPQHMGLPSHAIAAGMMHRGGPPPPYYGMGVPTGGPGGPPMVYSGGYPPQPHGGAGGDQDEHGYRNRNNGSVPLGGRGGGGIGGGRGNRGHKNNRRFSGRGSGGRGFYHQNSLDSESNEASPAAESGGDAGANGRAEVDGPVHSEVLASDKKMSNDAAE